ncbi:SigE family RNA polymerase sigma factor [Kutzneria sp. 744]|uniref:SigE family RNA polymerase sigma factor n=1 Tax=Kutzneria sp. (strain 744) TaxID=345341 RepID=UPI0003EEABA0|nr:SigE family RNA polymerase sigma factor [Kutzneria sp. 744]EWM19056.1 RNA polymerase sigma-E factor [Kutzneria sp. 744]
MATRDTDREFGEFVAARAVVVRRTAYLLCGDWHRAEDLMQTAFVRLYAAWSRLRRDDSVDAYVRKILVNAVIDESRRPFRRFENTVAEVGDVEALLPSVDDALDVRGALALLTPGQRATVVLRYWEDQSVEETASLLGCSEGTVKSQTAKGLATLRRLLGAGVAALEESA